MITKEIAEKLNIGDEVHYGCSCEYYSDQEMVWLVLHKCSSNPSGEDFVLPIKQKKTGRIGAIWCRFYPETEESEAGTYGNCDAFHVPSDCLYWKAGLN